MLKWFIRHRIGAFEKRYGYDMTYARELLATDVRAFLAFAKIQALGSYRNGIPPEVHFAAKLVGAMAEDCGPCTQLVVSLALEQRVDPRQLAAVLRRDDDAMTPAVRLATRFARAVDAHDAAADELRAEVVAMWGPPAVISIAFALAAARVYPTVKYALGHGKTCQRIEVAGVPVAVVRSAA